MNEGLNRSFTFRVGRIKFQVSGPKSQVLIARPTNNVVKSSSKVRAQAKASSPKLEGGVHLDAPDLGPNLRPEARDLKLLVSDIEVHAKLKRVRPHP